ncbi:MAG: hypothetical protein GQ558_01930 [Thermoplasmata archaeon]|nr:hypothetical protein [Thermoplasmata archaeon]
MMMIKWERRLLLTALLLFGLLVLCASSTMGWKLVEERDFTGTTGDPLDRAEWDVALYDPRNSINIDNNKVRIDAVTSNWVRAISNWTWETNNFTILLDWYPDTGAGGPLIVGTRTNSSGEWRVISYACYAPGYGWHAYRYPNEQSRTYISYSNNLVLDRWYTVNLTFRANLFNITVTQHGTGTVFWSKNNLATDSHEGENVMFLGASRADIYYDNLRIYDLDAKNLPPAWGDIPTIEAVEDVPLTYDFSSHVSDPDGPLAGLSLSSNSPYVTDIDGFNVTFEFPNGVLVATVPLVLRDIRAQVVYDVNFTILPVNDPPEYNGPTTWQATEDVPMIIDLAPYVTDVDNGKGGLEIETDDPFASVDGLILTMTFTEGIEQHTTWLNLTDGMAWVQIRFEFDVDPMNDPPSSAPLGTYTAVEDQASTFNLTPYLSDIDTPVEDLTVIVRHANVHVTGQVLHFQYQQGGFTDMVLIEVTDGNSLVDTNLIVSVEERNDAPIIHTISPKVFTEEETKTIDLRPYIEDEDTPRSGLSLTCEHPAVVGISGFNITMLYLTWEEEHTVNITVHDGLLSAHGSFLVQVQAVNDLPVIISIGDLLPPVTIMIDEDSELWYDIVVEDEDSTVFLFSIDSEWDGVTAHQNGTLQVVAEHGDIGTYNATLSVVDRDEGTATRDITIIVLNVNDPPARPVVTGPANHSSFREGEVINFTVYVDDPDMVLGQVLTVTWTSNISGEIGTGNSVQGTGISRSDLAPGIHRITVVVTDLQYSREAWFELTVLEEEVPDEDDGSDLLTSTTGILILIVAIVVVVVVVVVRFLTSGKEDGDTLTPPSSPPFPPQIRP